MSDILDPLGFDLPEEPPAPPGPQGPPYFPTTAQMGGRPDRQTDVPICAVFLVLFVSMAATHMTIFQINRIHNHKFLFSMLLFGFCMARIVALSTRIAWALDPTSLNIGIAAGIFTQAGVILLFIVNLLMSQRILRAYHPKIGWHWVTKYTYMGLLGIVITMLVMVISASIALFFTLDPRDRETDRIIQLVAGTFLAAVAFLPVPVVLASLVARKNTRIEKFGQGRFRTKVRLLLTASTLLSLGAGFRMGAAFAAPPVFSPAWFDSKVCFYCFNFGIEWLVVLAYAVARFDRRFHVPNGSFAPGHYTAGLPAGAGTKTKTKTETQNKLTLSDCINREEELFGSVAQLALTINEDAGPEAREEAVKWTQKAARELYGQQASASDASSDSTSETFYSASEGGSSHHS